MKIKSKIEGFLGRRYCRKQVQELNTTIENNTADKTLYLFCAPTHSNLGDQAQLMCWLRLLKEYYPDYRIICVPTKFKDNNTMFKLKDKVKPDDLLFIHSGYLIFDIHPELPFILDIVRAFYDHPITILPQTVNLKYPWCAKIVSDCFNSHPNLTLLCRDETSLTKAQQLFPKVQLHLMPDVVTTLIGNTDFQFEKKRDGILFCVRDDVERHYSQAEIDALKARFGKIKIEQCDTTIKAPIWKWQKEREGLIRKMLEYFAKFQCIITDRYHGTIFSQIVNTPVVVISSADHKLVSGVKWFPLEKFGQNITFAKDLDEAYEKTKTVLTRNGKVIKNPPYFKDNFYSKEKFLRIARGKTAEEAEQ
jgi:exopolysaccharide biosynthesis predicted pyruvyltransferase EpsI